MTGRGFFYTLWCLGMVALFMVSGVFAYSPFADGGRASRGSGFYGPTHK
ncbi:MAG: hypothetical protein V4574_19790 [Pseudomonadota bacterium]